MPCLWSESHKVFWAGGNQIAPGDRHILGWSLDTTTAWVNDLEAFSIWERACWLSIPCLAIASWQDLMQSSTESIYFSIKHALIIKYCHECCINCINIVQGFLVDPVAFGSLTVLVPFLSRHSLALAGACECTWYACPVCYCAGMSPAIPSW